MAVLEPLALLFREEVRAIAETLGMDSSIVQRKPFPLMGLGARIIGEVHPGKTGGAAQSRCDFQRGDSRSRAE